MEYQVFMNNIDFTEVNKFDALADEWWNPDGKLKTLHVINPVRLEYIENAIDLGGKRVLDLGCGGGLLTEAMALKNAMVTGIDASHSAIAAARQHLSSAADEQVKNSVQYFDTHVETFAQENENRFDVITCMELLEHVPDPGVMLEQCATMLKPGGQLFLATINRNLKSYLSAIVGAEYLLRLLPAGTHDYSSFIRPSELSRWLKTAGFAVKDISGMTYIPGIHHCMLTDRPNVNYLVNAELNG